MMNNIETTAKTSEQPAGFFARLKEKRLQKKLRTLEEKRKMRKEYALILTESALMLALATVLSEITFIRLPFGGNVTLFSQLPVILVSYRRGLKWGLGTGFAMSLLQALLGLNYYAYIAKTFTSVMVFFLADYIVAFSALGLGGMFRKKIKNQAVGLTLGAGIVSFIRYLCHVTSGILIWSEYAEDSSLVSGLNKLLTPIFGNMEFWTARSDKVLVVLYSICYNGAYMFFETLITVAGAILLSFVFDIRGKQIRPAWKTRKKSS